MLETMRNELKNLKKKHEKEMKEMKEELEKKDSEIKSKENEITSTIKSPSKRKKSVVIINITDENRERVSNLLGGMLSNSDGTYSRTPMSETWAKNKEQRPSADK